MKGQLLSSSDTSSGPRADILCVCFSQRHEWDSRNVIVTGCTNGVMQVIRKNKISLQMYCNISINALIAVMCEK